MMRRLATALLLWSALITGCALNEYDDKVTLGLSKQDVFWQLNFIKGQPTAIQVYFDPSTGTEVFFPDWGPHTENFGGFDEFMGDILVFRGVTRPTQCPLTSEDWPNEAQYRAGADYMSGRCYRGDGYLAQRIPVSDVAIAAIQDNEMASLLLAATEEFYAHRDQQIEILTKWYDYLEDDKALEEARKHYVDKRQTEHWRMIKENEAIWDWAQKNRLYDHSELKVARNEWYHPDPNFFPAVKRQWQLGQASGSRMTRVSRQSATKPNVARQSMAPAAKSSTASKSTSGFTSAFVNSFGDILGVALGAWLAHEIGLDVPANNSLSDKQLREIEQAARRGMRRAQRQQKIRDNLNKPVKIYCC